MFLVLMFSFFLFSLSIISIYFHLYFSFMIHHSVVSIPFSFCIFLIFFVFSFLFVYSRLKTFSFFPFFVLFFLH
uniref:Uncharacterized protein n=1 Tax=Panstrongylus lignarius TaxID=156445 RepID=A0A224XTQ8_9HEMI